jgi:uncharacterized membrane protein
MASTIVGAVAGAATAVALRSRRARRVAGEASRRRFQAVLFSFAETASTMRLFGPARTSTDDADRFRDVLLARS